MSRGFEVRILLVARGYALVETQYLDLGRLDLRGPGDVSEAACHSNLLYTVCDEGVLKLLRIRKGHEKSGRLIV
jgi:hypothetical protein